MNSPNHITNRHIPDDVLVIERNGRIFLAHPFRRYDVAAILGQGFGTVMQIQGTLAEGEEAERLAQERAAIDIRNAEAVREAAEEEAVIRGERGRRILATQKAQAAAGGIRINVGSPLVIAAETRAAIAKDTGFSLQRARVESEALRESARIEKEIGRAAKRKAKFQAISQGIRGFGSIALRSREGGGA